MRFTEHENYIRNVKMQEAQWIPAFIYLSDASWDEYREEMEAVALRYPEYFPYVRPGWRDYKNYEFPPNYNSKAPFTDNWGCVYKISTDGIIGAVVEHPLDDYNKLKNYIFPDPEVLFDDIPANYAEVEKMVEKAKQTGAIREAGLEHGHFFLRLMYLRGFENLMCDIADESEELYELAKKVEAIATYKVRRFVKMDISVFWFNEDLGMQTSGFISPKDFRRFVVPVYTRMIKPVRDAGILVGFHSDGYIMDIANDLITCGVDIINLQDKVNGIDVISKELKGRLCIRVDIDRQETLPYGTPEDIRDLVREEAEKLGSPKGGLEIIAGIYPPTPPRNVDALCSALREFRTMYF